MARRPGFTLIELLVCLAATAVLLALLLPAIAGVRAAAMKVVCVGRLRDLTFACNQYRMKHGSYPLQPGTTRPPGPLAGLPTLPALPALPTLPTAPVAGILPVPLLPQPPKPTEMDAGFLNVLRADLPYPRIEPTAGPADLPPAVQCPNVEDANADARVAPADLTFTRPLLYTGYAYCVRPKDRSLAPAFRLLKPERVASPKMFESDAVVWADDVHWSVSDAAWSFAHGVPRAEQGPKLLTYAEARGLLGQHRAYTDGHVEWVHGSQIDLDVGGNTLLDAANPKASMSVFDLYFFWF